MIVLQYLVFGCVLLTYIDAHGYLKVPKNSDLLADPNLVRRSGGLTSLYYFRGKLY